MPPSWRANSVWLRPGPDPFIDHSGRLVPIGILREPLGVVPVLEVEVAVPVDEPHDWRRPGGRHRDRGSEGIVGALLIDVGLVAAVAEGDNAESAVRLDGEAAVDPLDGVGMRAAQDDTPVEVMPTTGMLLLLDRNEHLAGFVVLAGGALGLFALLQLFERFLTQAVVAGSILSALLVIVPAVLRTRPDSHPSQYKCRYGERTGPDGGPGP